MLPKLIVCGTDMGDAVPRIIVCEPLKKSDLEPFHKSSLRKDVPVSKKKKTRNFGQTVLANFNPLMTPPWMLFNRIFKTS